MSRPEKVNISRSADEPDDRELFVGFVALVVRRNESGEATYLRILHPEDTLYPEGGEHLAYVYVRAADLGDGIAPHNAT